MLLEVQHRGDSHIVDRRRSRPNADGVGLSLSQSRRNDLAIEQQARISALISGVVGAHQL